MTHASDGVSRSPIHLFHRASQCAEMIFHASVAEGVTPRQLAVLVVIAECEGASQTDITQRTGIDRSTMADVVRRMVKKGLLERRRSRTDIRAYELRLTDEGRKVLQAAIPVARRVDARVLDALPRARREQFLAALGSIVEALDGAGSRAHARSGVRAARHPESSPNGVMPSRTDVLGFAARTRENLECIERAFETKDSGHVITQLVSSLLGLIVFPHEQYLDASLKELRLSLLVVQGWPKWNILKGECETLGGLVRRLRNAVAHGRLRFSSDSRHIGEVTIEVEDWHPHARGPHWRARIGAADLRAFCLRYVALIKDTVGSLPPAAGHTLPEAMASSFEENHRSGLFVRR
jgi:DNA-binding MarR family transcriptional regulator